MKLRWTVYFLLLTFVTFAQEQERGLVSNRNITNVEKKLGYAEKYALVIGVNEYADSRIPNLTYAVNDAQAISKLLVNKLGFDTKNVTILLDTAATRTRILDIIQKKYIDNEDIDENSELLVYFAGHGSVLKNGNKGFLLTHDSKDGSELATSIGMDEIGRISSELKPKHALFLIDACYGGFTNTRSGSSAYIKNVWNQKSRQVITAGNSDEKVLESTQWQHSIFTKVLLDGIEKEEADINNDKIISANELHVYMEQRIAFYASEKGGKQTPQMGRLTPDEGTFFFELEEGALKNLDGNSKMEKDEDFSEKLKSTLTIRSNIKSARVYMDNIEIGYLSNNIFEYKVKPGFYKFDLRLEKYETATEEILIRPDSSVSVFMPLTSTVSLVTFIVSPQDAVVLLNSNVIGSGSFTSEIPKGRHELSIEKKGYKPEKSLINLVQDTTRFDFEIHKIQSLVELVSNPPGALVLNNMDTLGVTPLNVNLGFGVQNLIFLKDKYIPKQFMVDIKESGLQRHDVFLELKPEVIVKQQVAKKRAKSIGNFAIYGILSGGAYYGYKYFKGEVEQIEATNERVDEKSLYNVGKYGSLGLTAIFGIAAISNGVKAATISTKKELRKNMEERQLSLMVYPQPYGGQLGLNLRF